MALTNEEKRQIIALRKEVMTMSTIALKFNVNKTTVKRLFRKYLLHGDEILEDQFKRQRYSDEMKLKIIKEYYEESSKISLCIKHLVSECLLTEWIKIYDTLGDNGFTIKKWGRPNMKDEKELLKSLEKEDLSKPLTDAERKELKVIV
jgi:transposase-like protein